MCCLCSCHWVNPSPCAYPTSSSSNAWVIPVVRGACCLHMFRSLDAPSCGFAPASASQSAAAISKSKSKSLILLILIIYTTGALARSALCSSGSVRSELANSDISPLFQHAPPPTAPAGGTLPLARSYLDKRQARSCRRRQKGHSATVATDSCPHSSERA